MKREDYVKLVNAIIMQNDNCIMGNMTQPAILQTVILEYLENETKDSNDKKFGSYLRWWLFDRPNAGLNSKEAWLNDKKGNKHFIPDAWSLFDYLMNE
jgi:hypothetical protein